MVSLSTRTFAKDGRRWAEDDVITLDAVATLS